MLPCLGTHTREKTQRKQCSNSNMFKTSDNYEEENREKGRQKKKRRRKKDGDHHRNKTRGFMLELNDGNSTYIHTVVTSVSRAYHSGSAGK